MTLRLPLLLAIAATTTALVEAQGSRPTAAESRRALTRAGAGALSLAGLRTAAAAKVPEAMAELGDRILDESKTEAERAAAVKWSLDAAVGGSTRGMVAWARAKIGGFGTPVDREEAVKWLRRASEAGDPEGMTVLGLALRHPETGPPDHAAAVALFRMAAASGYPPAMT